MTGRPSAQPTPGEQPPGAGSRRRPALGISTHAASAGLVAVLVVLTAFSVGAAVVNAAAAAEAELSVDVSEAADVAEESLALQEELVDDLSVGDDAGIREQYLSAVAATRGALREIGTVAHGDDPRRREHWLASQSAYAAASVQLTRTSTPSRGSSATRRGNTATQPTRRWPTCAAPSRCCCG